MHLLIATAGTEAADADLVAAVRAGDDSAFEELYRRYHPRIARVRVRDAARRRARCEDVAQEAFLSALRRMRATDAEINFKPWIYQIARNAAIDSLPAQQPRGRGVHGRRRRPARLRPDPARRGSTAAPDAALVTKERLTTCRAPSTSCRTSTRACSSCASSRGCPTARSASKLDLTRPAVESALFRARRRLESEYTELSEGRRCEAMRQTMIARMAAGTHRARRSTAWRATRRRCHDCRRRARELGIEPLTDARHAAPEGGGAAADPMALPPLGRRRRHDHRTVLHGRERRPAGGTRRGPRGSGRAGGCGRRSARRWSAPRGPRDGRGGPSRGRALHGGERGIAARHSRAATDGERAGRAPGVRAEASGPAGGRAGGSGGSSEPSGARHRRRRPARLRAGPTPTAPLRRSRCRRCPRAPLPAPRAPTRLPSCSRPGSRSARQCQVAPEG